MDTEKSKELYRRWLAMTRPGSLKSGLRRSEVFDRRYRSNRETFFVGKD